MKIAIALGLASALGAAHAQTGPLVYDANGTLVGLINSGQIVTPKGFWFTPARNGGVFAGSRVDAFGWGYGNEALYVLPGCQGQAYVSATHGFLVAPAGRVIINVGPDEEPALFYVPGEIAPLQRTFASVLRNGVCSDSVSNPLSVEAYPNDPGVTGVPVERWLPPYEIRMEPYGLLFDLLKDGFEGTWIPSRLAPAAQFDWYAEAFA